MNEPDAAAPDVDTPSTPHDPEPVGSVAQEAFKLFRAVATPSAAQGVGADDGADEVRTGHPAGHECTTTWCPVCQVVGFVRDNPDAIASVTRSATDLARSLRDLVDAALAPEEKKQ
ncbi:hypothetical protein IFT73_15100 [Aeromicrobium sp. CFBP 8757]|uniref:hypothetical protein n=1 Tax=Aeromicrobium sp. CFBP 8757 TaxID=2775288 RepID=UPI00178120E5|nr:hypothetical protein [Aeromicrobium sp. CFBP 8757]MBD8608184.1 hypothetical protein [Aeromicrobium sp. CFBP 8757]